MSCFHGSKIAGSKQSFLTETAFALYNRTQSRTFFFPCSQDHGLLRSRNFAIMALWCKQLLLSSVSGLKAYQG